MYNPEVGTSEERCTINLTRVNWGEGSGGSGGEHLCQQLAQEIVEKEKCDRVIVIYYNAKGENNTLILDLGASTTTTSPPEGRY